ncbi:HNH endonuclease family protein [Azospirillum doebereinerae]|uniref:HNH endonuclease n=1 Tax=Azospirillum doebereinerae TaxID=92933 RepID=A0A433J614_9PROT|nr:HNH endonuclease family protein [Azospirillum doebereinerae]MCG5238239.1 HNH endonuclease family protein [Azospirillum doebereinerae]RUQ68164.1 HNH endonuclease [Azospirillum doebereinerae]
MAGRWGNSGGGSRKRSLTLRGLFTVLAILAALAVAERLHILPAGTLERLLGQEEKKGRNARVHTPPPVVARASDRIDFDKTQRLLDGIRVEEEKRGGYEREEWPHWLALDRGCLNAREQVLIRDSRRPAKLSDKGCAVASGEWIDPYTGDRITDPNLVDIDHRVPLEETYASGGHAWSRDRRAAYANDLTDPLTLLAASREANRAKGSKGPEDWLPPKRDGICLYVADWIAVKARWELTMDERERVTVGNILADCRASAR